MIRKLGLSLIMCLALTGFAWASAYSTAVLSTPGGSPLAYFQFEDGTCASGDPAANTGTTGGTIAAQYIRLGTGPQMSLVASIPTLGTAALFSGASGGNGTLVDIMDNGYSGDLLTNTSMTVEMLMLSTADASNYPTVYNSHDDNISPGLSFGDFSGPPVETYQPFVTATGSAWYAWPPGILGDGSWHQYVVTFSYDGTPDETTAEIFMDKQSKGTHVFAGAIGPNATDIWIDILLGAAGNQNYVYNGFVGLMDEVAIYDYALTSTQITDHYNALPEPATIALLGLGGLLLRRKK